MSEIKAAARFVDDQHLYDGLGVLGGTGKIKIYSEVEDARIRGK